MDYSKFYSEHSGEAVQAEMLDGSVFTGRLISYASAGDNEPEPEGIIIDNGACVELFTNKIKSIRAL